MKKPALATSKRVRIVRATNVMLTPTAQSLRGDGHLAPAKADVSRENLASSGDKGSNMVSLRFATPKAPKRVNVITATSKPKFFLDDTGNEAKPLNTNIPNVLHRFLWRGAVQSVH